MIADIRAWADWMKGIPSAFPSVIRYLTAAPSMLGTAQRARWVALLPKLDSAVQILELNLVDPATGWALKVWEANLAACILNFAYPAGAAGDRALLNCAVGVEPFTPGNEKEVEDWKFRSDQLQNAIDKEKAFGMVNTSGVA